ncbi:flavodoxin family protein [Allobacillus halotolerans]|uniref:Flavodoxin family protein n=1 Tax=Allobacillus halotolerans TaxID=570278 RepID=A0ABS6GR10_9BACI|nr:flavodoxin family protein [Allobacillus halotolerans]MBU6081542.1 flavodoxin family protein [Allobacillus halotolerans]
MALKCVFLNTSLKKSGEKSNTEALFDEAKKVYEKEGVEVEVLRMADYNIPVGISDDLGEGDEWPGILQKILNADIFILGSPVWLGEKSSLAKKALERLNGSSGQTNDKGQEIFYNRVAGSVVTGNEDGAKHASHDIIYGLSHLGFTIPPNADAYWVGEAGPGPSYMEAGTDSDFTQNAITTLAYNTTHFARMLNAKPIPAEGNVTK